MGGHGGLNILPQKKWNVYNFDNREKVKRDEEAAAKHDQTKRDHSRKQLSDHRLRHLRQARGLAGPSSAAPEPEPEAKSKLDHINLFDGIRVFDPVKEDDEREGFKKKMKVEKAKKKEEVRVVLPEDEKYRLGYGVAGKGVKLPWYMSKPIDEGKSGKNDSSDDDDGADDAKHEAKSNGKKTLEKLREERLMREKKEKERERALIMEKRKRDGAGYSDRRSSRR